MKKKKNSLIFWIIGLVLTIPAFYTLIGSQFLTFHDETQLANLHQYIKTISLGQFPPRWAPDMVFAYGTPFPEFNYQLPYYIAFLLSQIGLHLTDIFKALMILSLISGMTGMYLLGLQIVTPIVALAGALLYTYTPYRAVDIFVRGTLGESLAFGIFPWILFFLIKLITKPTLKNFLGTSVTIALLFINHQPATLITLPFILFTTFFTALILKKYRVALFQIISGLLALGISAYYWVPVLSEKSFIKSGGPFNFYDHFPFLKQLVYSKWGYGSSNWGPYDDFSFMMGFLNLFFLFAGAVLIPWLVFTFFKKPAGDHKTHLLMALSTVSCFMAIFLMNIRSSFIWNNFPFTQDIQFPWRFLMVTTFFTPVIFMAIGSLPIKKKLLTTVSWIVIILSIGLNVGYFHPGEVVDHNDDYFMRRFLPNQVLYPGETVSAEYLNHTEDYVPMPVLANRPKSMPPSKLTSFIGDSIILPVDENPFHYKATITSPSDDMFTFHTFYFPGWVVSVDNKQVPITPDKNGVITFFLPSGKHSIEVDYLNTQTRTISNIISLVLISGIVTSLIYQSIHKRA